MKLSGELLTGQEDQPELSIWQPLHKDADMCRILPSECLQYIRPLDVWIIMIWFCCQSLLTACLAAEYVNSEVHGQGAQRVCSLMAVSICRVPNALNACVSNPPHKRAWMAISRPLSLCVLSSYSSSSSSLFIPPFLPPPSLPSFCPLSDHPAIRPSSCFPFCCISGRRGPVSF